MHYYTLSERQENPCQRLSPPLLLVHTSPGCKTLLHIRIPNLTQPTKVHTLRCLVQSTFRVNAFPGSLPRTGVRIAFHLCTTLYIQCLSFARSVVRIKQRKCSRPFWRAWLRILEHLGIAVRAVHPCSMPGWPRVFFPLTILGCGSSLSNFLVD
jgi:hypothetical protein